MNPIVRDALEHVASGKRITRITVDCHTLPRKAIFEFVDDTTSHCDAADDRRSFMDVWKEAGRIIRLLGLINPLEDLE